MLLTPVTVLADGALVIVSAYGVAYYVGLAIVGLPFCAAKEAMSDGTKKC